MAHAARSESIHELLVRAPDALFGHVASESVGRAEGVVESAAPGEPLEQAVSRMWWRKMGALPVVEDGRLVGSLTEDDLLHLLAERMQGAEVDDDLVIWRSLLEGVTVAEAMTVCDDAAVVAAGTPLRAGLEATFGPTPDRRRKSYVFVVDADARPVRVISFRDIARHLVRLYDGDVPASLFADPLDRERAQRLAWSMLDVSLGRLREEQSLGSPPHPQAADARGPHTIARMAARARGYAVVLAPDGDLRGICTRRDVLRALKNPFVRVDALGAVSLMTEPVKTVSETDTLCGLFKMMAIDGFRHMPLVNEADKLECVISIWQGVGLLAHPPASDARDGV
jgi:CBS domain-containing protein